MLYFYSYGLKNAIKEATTMVAITNDKWISIEDAAEYLGVKSATIRDWIRKDKGIPAQKIGKQWKFKCSELDMWVKSGKSAIGKL